MYIADLHIHSKYSRATSKELEPEPLDAWARRKGIGLVGTGDFTHPTWRAELRDKLAEAEEGLYTLKGAGPDAPRFVITGEISSIYKKNGKVRKVHSLILLPHLEAAETLSRRLEAIGNLHSDGRPILGLDCRDLLEITLESCPDAVFIPAHIWTPHFSLFGAFSGFDTIGECFGDLTGHIHALETGLSSDPTMICRCSALDGYTLVSNSDAHSPSKLGREANLLDTGLSYPELARAIQTGEGFHGTIEFFPEEGKYHFDGHRNCGVCLSPVEAEAAGGVCPVCGKRLTTGVLHRVEQLADRPEGYIRPDARPFESLVPLPEVIAASEGGSAAGKKVGAKYEAMLAALGPEFTILREVPVEDIRAAAGPCVAEGIRRLRAGQVVRRPGYDGAYGVIELLSPAEREDLKGQVSLFGAEAPKAAKTARGRVAKPARSGEEGAAPAGGLNGAQRTAASAEEATVAVLAGPGTGKTHTLVERVAWLVEERGAKPSELTAVTFTNRAAGELRARLEGRLGKRAARAMTIGTFHAICLELLGAVPLAGPYEQRAAAAAALAELGRKGSPGALLRAVSRHKTGADGGDDPAFALYQEKLEGKLDFDDLLLETLRQWEGGQSDRRFTHLLVDEFQDIDRLQLRLLRPGGGADGEADGELPLHPGDSRRGPSGGGGHRRRAPAHGDPQPPRGGGASAHRRGGSGGGHLRGQGDRPDGGWHRHAGGPGAGGRPGRAELRGYRGALPYPAAGGPAGGVSGPRRHPLRGHRPGGFSVGRGGAGRAGLAGGAAGGGKVPRRPPGGVDGPPHPLWRGGAAAQYGGVFRGCARLSPQPDHRAGGGSAAPGRAELCRRSGDPLHPPRGQGPRVAGGIPVRRWGGPHSAGAEGPGHR